MCSFNQNSITLKEEKIDIFGAYVHMNKLCTINSVTDIAKCESLLRNKNKNKQTWKKNQRTDK